MTGRRREISQTWKQGNETQEETRQTKKRDRWGEDKQEKTEKTDTEAASRRKRSRGGETKRDGGGEGEKMYVSALHLWQILLWGASPVEPAPPLPRLPGLPVLPNLFPQPTLGSFPPLCKNVLLSPPRDREIKGRDLLIGLPLPTFEVSAQYRRVNCVSE